MTNEDQLIFLIKLISIGTVSDTMRLTLKVSSFSFYIKYIEVTKNAPSRLYSPKVRDGFLFILILGAEGIQEPIKLSIYHL